MRTKLHTSWVSTNCSHKKTAWRNIANATSHSQAVKLTRVISSTSNMCTFHSNVYKNSGWQIRYLLLKLPWLIRYWTVQRCPTRAAFISAVLPPSASCSCHRIHTPLSVTCLFIHKHNNVCKYWPKLAKCAVHTLALCKTVLRPYKVLRPYEVLHVPSYSEHGMLMLCIYGENISQQQSSHTEQSANWTSILFALSLHYKQVYRKRYESHHLLKSKLIRQKNTAKKRFSI